MVLFFFKELMDTCAFLSVGSQSQLLYDTPASLARDKISSVSSTASSSEMGVLASVVSLLSVMYTVSSSTVDEDTKNLRGHYQ